MKEYIKEFTNYLEGLIKDNKKVSKDEMDNIINKIYFIQHERFIHLIVTFFFALFTIIFFILGIRDVIYFIPCLILIIVLGFYIAHYYSLENSTQEIYRLYDKIYSLKNKK